MVLMSVADISLRYTIVQKDCSLLKNQLKKIMLIMLILMVILMGTDNMYLFLEND